MRSFCTRLIAGALLMGALPLAAHAASTTFGPSPYLLRGDTPAGFACDQCLLHIEDFEDNALDPFLTIDNGAILLPDAMSGATNPVTDSVDGDDGSVDGSGTGGHSWFTGSEGAVDRMLTITFDSTVTSAGLVFTDGDPISSEIKLEAFDINGLLLASLAGDLADGNYTGETAEDRFLGFHDADGIASLTLTMTGGTGIEIDHIHWQNCLCVPEPATMGLMAFALLGLMGIRRRR